MHWFLFLWSHYIDWYMENCSVWLYYWSKNIFQRKNQLCWYKELVPCIKHIKHCYLDVFFALLMVSNCKLCKLQFILWCSGLTYCHTSVVSDNGGSWEENIRKTGDFQSAIPVHTDWIEAFPALKTVLILVHIGEYVPPYQFICDRTISAIIMANQYIIQALVKR